jgi:hypothetical protein
MRYENMKICQKHERNVEERRTDVTIEKCPAQAFCGTGLLGVIAKYVKILKIRKRSKKILTCGGFQQTSTLLQKSADDDNTHTILQSLLVVHSGEGVRKRAELNASIQSGSS